LQQSSPANAMRLQVAGQYSACNNELRDDLNKLTIVQTKVLASCAFYSGDFRTASAAAQSLKENPATVVQGLYWESKADQKLAIGALARAGEVEPNSPQMRILLGDVYRQKRRWSEAESEYRKALALDPKSRNARLNLAIDLFTELKNDEALDLDKSLLAEVPDDAEANLLAGEILVQQHQYEQAEPYLNKCSKLKEDLRPQLHLMLGQVYSETGRIPEAISEYKSGLSTDQDGSIHYQLARLYQKSGDAAAASEQIRISKQLRERWDNQAHVVLEQRSTDLSRQ
jgi:predicted Zn-dependent protease